VDTVDRAHWSTECRAYRARILWNLRPRWTPSAHGSPLPTHHVSLVTGRLAQSWRPDQAPPDTAARAACSSPATAAVSQPLSARAELASHSLSPRRAPASTPGRHLIRVCRPSSPDPRPHAATMPPRPCEKAPPPPARRPSRNRLSPFSTEKVVYAGFGFHSSARFQHLWTALWINEVIILQTCGLHLLETPAARGPSWSKRCTLRTSSAARPVEKPGVRGYNDGGLSARPINSHHVRGRRLSNDR